MSINDADAVDISAWLLLHRGTALLEKDDVAGAGRDLMAALQLCIDGSLSAAVGMELLQRLAATAARDGRLEVAATLTGMFSATIVDVAIARDPTVDRVNARYLADVPARLGAAFEAAADRGHNNARARRPQDVLRAALELFDDR